MVLTHYASLLEVISPAIYSQKVGYTFVYLALNYIKDAGNIFAPTAAFLSKETKHKSSRQTVDLTNILTNINQCLITTGLETLLTNRCNVCPDGVFKECNILQVQI